MIVTPDNFVDVVAAIDKHTLWVVDTETTGLRPHHGDVLFSVIIKAGDSCYYFNTIEYNGELAPIVDLSLLRKSFDKARCYVFHNAKFDITMLAKAGLHIPAKSQVYCTMTADRIVCGNRLYHSGGFSLDAMSLRYGGKKDSTVEQHISENNLYEDIQIPGRIKPIRNKFYNLVPFSIIVPYGIADVRATHKVFLGQLEKLEDTVVVGEQPGKTALLDNEMDLLRCVHGMETLGAMVDLSYVRSAISHYQKLLDKTMKAFKRLTGFEFEPKTTLYKKIFVAEKWVYTEKGNPSFAGEVLDTFNGPAAQLVNTLRECKHQISTYQALIYHCANGVVHTHFNQHVARTGRFSSSHPNLQNMERPGHNPAVFTARRAIIPRPGCFLAAIDYNQVEYRLMLDCAGAHGLIAQVNSGLDVHTAMAELIGIDRTTMKNGNFALLYGSGNEALASTIGGTLQQAKSLRTSIQESAPEVTRWIELIKSTVRRRGYVYNWLGRVFKFPANEAYKAPNAMIQGGCADIMKVAMVRVAAYLKMCEDTKMILTIHDELILEVPYGCEEDVTNVCKIMEIVYKPINDLPLTCSVEWSDTNLAEKKKWL